MRTLQHIPTRRRVLFLCLALILVLSAGLSIALASPGFNESMVRLHIYKDWDGAERAPLVVRYIGEYVDPTKKDELRPAYVTLVGVGSAYVVDPEDPIHAIFGYKYLRCDGDNLTGMMVRDGVFINLYYGLGPPVDVEEYAGDRKTALLWDDPLDVTVDYYQIKIDGFDWVDYPQSVLTKDGGKWYLLLEELPDGTDLVNDVEYSFEIRAVDVRGVLGDPFEIKSTPNPLGDIGGRNTDLLSVYDIDLMPQGGWPDPADNNGVGASATNPYEESIELPTDFDHAVLHRNFIEVGEDATFVMYADSGFSIAVDLIDRMDNQFVWLPEVYMYICVTSGNGEIVRYYVVTVTIPQP